MSIESLSFQASGIISIIACGKEYPPITNNSKALSNVEESDGEFSIIGQSLSKSSPSVLDFILCFLEFIQLMFPLTVLISPL